MKIKLCVLFGGKSVEHEVSIITAIQAINKMDKAKYDIIPVYIDKTGKWYTGQMLLDIEIYKDLDLLKRYAKEVVLYNRDGRFVLQNKKGLFKTIVTDVDLAFPIMHGTNGEDGTLQGYLETIGIPYCESNVYASALGQDKILQKQVLKENNVNIVKYKWFYDTEYLTDPDKVIASLDKLEYPLIVKPATLGSSVGISVAHDELELREYIMDAIEYDSKILVEEVVKNLKEVNIAVMGNYENQKVSAIEEVLSANKFLTYTDKYIGGGKGKLKGSKAPLKTTSKGMASASRKLPADLDEKMQKEIEEIAIKAFKALGTSGNSRIDFLVDEKSEKVYINEINSIPGSLAFYLWEAQDKTFTQVLDEMIHIAISDYKKRMSKTHSFDSNILEGFAANGIKGTKGIKGKLR